MQPPPKPASTANAVAAPHPADAVVSALAVEIMRYLSHHPLQADTDKHIARWWLLQSRVEQSVGQVRAALQHLETIGQVERGPGGVYRLPVVGQGNSKGSPS